jgi:predicted anti-sigma-YlaC factor YlaD
MNKENCEEILTALMAVFDGETTRFAPEQLNAHLSACENCRREIEQMQNTFALLKTQERHAPETDLWSAIETRIEAETRTNWKPFVSLGVFLVVYKLLEMLPEIDFGFAFKIVPLVFVVALFAFLKENPFRINTELILEK